MVEDNLLFNINKKDFKNEIIKKYDDDKDGVYLFISFDFVGSTELKVSNPKWFNVIVGFYESINFFIKNLKSKIFLWKSLGDELLYYKKIDTFKDLDVIEHIIKHIENISIIKNIKITLWLANIDRIKNFLNDFDDIDTRIDDFSSNHLSNFKLKKSDSDNILESLKVTFKKIDFIGEDIDIGFRIAKFTKRCQIIMPIETIYILLIFKIIETNNIRFAGYEVLKGVWLGKPYPIYWVKNDWEIKQDCFPYYEILDIELYKNIKENKNIHKIEDIKKILVDIGKLEYLENIANNLKS